MEGSRKHLEECECYLMRDRAAYFRRENAKLRDEIEQNKLDMLTLAKGVAVEQARAFAWRAKAEKLQVELDQKK